MRRLIFLSLLVAAAGCAALRPISQPARSPDAVPATAPETPAQASERRAQAPRPAYNLAGYPPAARDGYIDGCESARQSRYGRKDAKRMTDDSQYAMGWNDGFSICARK